MILALTWEQSSAIGSLAVCLVTLVLGAIGSRRKAAKDDLELLREEVGDLREHVEECERARKQLEQDKFDLMSELHDERRR